MTQSAPKRLRFFGICVVMLCFGGWSNVNSSDADEFRHWTTAGGVRSAVRLKVVKRLGDRVTLEREDSGKVVSFKLNQLSTLDQKYLARQLDRAKQAAGDSTSMGDWPQWRGPDRDGKSPATGLIKQWPADGPELLWNVNGMGEGYSTPSVLGKSIYLLGAKGGDEFVMALNSEDGSKRWETRIGPKTGGGGFPGPRGTPTVDGEMLYAVGGEGTLVCLQRSSGDVVWKKEFAADFGGQSGHWKYCESPLVDDDKLICTPGGKLGAVVALNKTNGRLLWQSPVAQFAGEGSAVAAYASPIAANILGLRQYIVFLQGGVFGIDAKRGRPLWGYKAPANDTANCSTPVVLGNQVFAASAYGNGGGRATISRRGTQWSANEDYFVKKMENHHGGFVLHDGHIYGTNNSVLLCMEWETGDIKWQDRCVGKGSVTFADGHLYVRGEKGGVALVQATPDEYIEKGKFSQPDRSDKNAWPYPVVAGKRLYLHDQDRLLCFSLE